MTIIPNWLHQRAYLTPNRVAVICGEQRLTWRELDQQVDVAARRLAGLGIAAGDRVALLMRNSLDFAVLVHAASRIGAVLVPLNVRLTAPEIVWQLTDVGARLLVCDEPHSQTAITIRTELPSLRIVSTVDTDNFQKISAIPEAGVPLVDHVDLDAVANIIYTSGTTGSPKGAMLTYGNLWWSATGSALNLGLHAEDVWLAVLPLFHVGGLSILIRTAIYGNTAIIHPSFDPVEVNRCLDEEGVTIVSVVSAMLQRLLDVRGDKPFPPSLRCVLLGGGPAPRPLLEACAARNIPVVQTYGLTETASQIVTLPPEDALIKLGSAGKPLFPSEIRIEQDGDSVPAGEVGEIVVRGPTVTPGYYNRSDATAAAMRDGWLHTGDLGYLDEDGYLYVVSRRVDLIVSGGENIYPAEVEAMLLSHPAVEEAGVIGVEDAQWGQVPAAAIKLRVGQNTTADELKAFCAKRLARYKIPAHIWFVEALPRNAAGKLLHYALADDWRKRHP